MMKQRNKIEEQKVLLIEQKLAALLERNKLEEKKVDLINNVSNILLNLIAFKQNVL